MFGLNLDPVVLQCLGIAGGVLVIGAAILWAVRLAKTTTENMLAAQASLERLQRLEPAIPLLEQISKEFKTDHSSTLKDAMDREEAMSKQQAELLQQLQRSIEQVIHEQIGQAVKTVSHGEIISQLILELRVLKEAAARANEVTAARELEKLISSLQQRRDTLYERASTPITLTVTQNPTERHGGVEISGGETKVEGSLAGASVVSQAIKTADAAQKTVDDANKTVDEAIKNSK